MNASQMTLEEYRAAVADLPRPTAEQMHEFVRYVASAHSWYKHLPLWPPGRQFTFFLDPGAGMQRVVTADGSMDVIDREVQGFHYSWLPTRDGPGQASSPGLPAHASKAARPGHIDVVRNRVSRDC